MNDYQERGKEIKTANFTRNFTLSGVTVVCPFCNNEIRYSVEEATELVSDLWYPLTEEIECPECKKTFEITEGEDDF